MNDQNYQDLLREGQEIYQLSSISKLLGWDQETYMPKGGAGFRAEQMALLSSITHEKKTSDSFKSKLAKLIHISTGTILNDDLDERHQAALRQWRRDFLNEKKLPNPFVKEFASITSQASLAWVEAKDNNSFLTFAPHLEKVLEASKQKAEFLGYEDHPFDALVDLHEPGMTTAKLKNLFGELKPILTELTRTLSKDAAKPDRHFLHGNFDKTTQNELIQEILELLGLDFNHLRIDYSAHPFCIPLSPEDVRLTTHTETSNIFGTISAVMHEAGHGLYELGLPKEDIGSPLAEAASLGIHESQSRWYETFIGQSLPFWKHTYSKLQNAFPKALGDVSLDRFYRAINHVEVSPIRVHADEVTYILHIILRFEIEMELLTGDIAIHDLPDVWNSKMEESLGIVPKNDREGCLQDIHWSLGLFGYFPTYALGNVYAGQLFAQFKKEFPDWDKRMALGDMKFIHEYLYQNIHRYGRQYTSLELIERATGQELSVQPYIQYLKEKYL